MARGLGVVTIIAGVFASAVASAAGAPPPDAKITWVRGEASTLSPAPAPAKPDATLRHGDRVRTEDRAAVQVTFVDGSRVELGEKTLVLFGLGSMTLANGSVLEDATGARPPAIGTESARVVVSPGSARVSIDDKKVTRVAVYDGARTTIAAQKKDVVVPAGSGSKAEPGKAPTPPKPLPGAPAWKSPPPSVAFTSAATAAVKGSYQRGTTGDAPAQYHVQVARDATFLQIVTDVTVPDSTTEVFASSLAPGDYHVRVSAIDADRFEGPFGPVANVHVVWTATPTNGPWSQSIPYGAALAGLFCSIDGGPMTAVAPDLALDRFHAHDVKCSRTADGSGAGTFHVDAEPFTLSWALIGANAHTHSATLRATAKDAAGHPVDHVTLAVANATGVDVDVFASEERGVYGAKIGWTSGVTQLAAKVAANGEAHGEVALALPSEAGDQDVLPLPPKVATQTTLGELGIEAGFTGAANGIGPLVGFRGGVRQDLGRFEISVNAIFSMEARATDETGGLPLGLTGGTIVSSYSTSERVYVVGVPLEARYKLGKSPFSAGLGLTPFLAFENANVGYFGGNVSLRSPNTLFGANILGVVHLVAGPGTIVLGAGVRVSTTRDREVIPVDLLGPYVSLGYRLAL